MKRKQIAARRLQHDNDALRRKLVTAIIMAPPVPHHALGGNCWFGQTNPSSPSFDVCSKHDEPRGECNKCAPCPACKEMELEDE